MFDRLITKSVLGYLLLAVMVSPADARGKRFHLDTALSAERGIWTYLSGRRNSDGDVNNLVYAHDQEGHGVLFRCQGKRLYVTFMVEPGDFRDVLTRPPARVRKRTVEVTFADSSNMTANVYYFPSSRTAMAKDRTLIARVFKSAVQSEAIDVTVTHKPTAEIQFPEPDDAFDRFVDACAVIS